MTVNASAGYRKDYMGNGATKNWPVPFYFLDATHLRVILTDTSVTPNVSVDLTLNSDFTAAGAGDPTGGSITTTLAYSSVYKITILRNVPLGQDTAYPEGGPFPAASHERALDRLTMIVQQQAEAAGRALALPPSTSSSVVLPNPSAGQLLGWDASGSAVVNYPPTTNSAQALQVMLGDTGSASNGAGLVGHDDTNAYPAGTVGAFLNRFKDYANALYGAGMSGFAYALAYGANTVGAAIKAVMDRCTLLETFRRIPTVKATVDSNALTLGLAAQSIDFRSSPVSSGVVNTRTMGAAISLVVPAGATLGTVNAQQARLALLAIDNAGTVELAVVNLRGGNNLDETTLIDTTAISASSTANNVIYSTTARTSVPFRVVGFIDITEATAGTWATSPNTVQGQGGQAMAALQSIGYGQTWQSVSRTAGTTYYNHTGKPIVFQIACSVDSAVTGVVTVTVNGVAVTVAQGGQSGGSYNKIAGNIIIPPGASYVYAISNATLSATWELR